MTALLSRSCLPATATHRCCAIRVRAKEALRLARPSRWCVTTSALREAEKPYASSMRSSLSSESACDGSESISEERQPKKTSQCW
eukprot:2040322-Pleurochrysis_carterae.AAC.3